MKSPLLRLAIAVVRAWTRLYTWRMPATPREARRAEIESDLWEFEHDVAGDSRISPAMHVLLRLIAGVPHDLQWRVEAVPRDRRLQTKIALTATAFLVAALWALNALRTPELPPLPVSVQLVDVELLSPPPPPPPPPCRPGASTRVCPP